MRAHTSDESLDEAFLQILAVQAQRVPLPVFFGCAIIASMAATRVAVWLPLLWLLAVAGMLFVRYRWVPQLTEEYGGDIGRRLLTAGRLSMANGLTHASSLAFFPFLSDVEKALQTLLLLGLATGAIATTAGRRNVLYRYLAPVALALIVSWIGLGVQSQRWIFAFTGIGIAMFCVVLIAIANDSYRLFTESYHIRREQIELNRRLETALQAAQEANYAKALFLSSASHDLRQPAHVLAMLASALKRCQLDQRGREIVHTMSGAIDAMKSQLDTLLDISNIDAGKFQVRMCDLRLHPFLEDLLSRYRQRAQEKGLQLTLHGPEDCMISSDPGVLTRILGNLIDNAVKYTQHGHIDVSIQVEHQHVQLAIRDTGVGIAQEDHERIFEEFYQVGNRERDRELGLGLGLSIVKRYVGLVGGRIALQSQPGVGSCFTLTLPLGTTRAPSAVSVAASTALHGAHLLLVDDDRQVREAMKLALEAEQIRVTTCADIPAALAAIQTFVPDAIIADLRLRDQVTGIDAIHAVRAALAQPAPQGASAPMVPALLVSGDTSEERIKLARDAGLTMLFKPVNTSALIEALVAHMPAQTLEKLGTADTGHA